MRAILFDQVELVPRKLLPVQENESCQTMQILRAQCPNPTGQIPPVRLARRNSTRHPPWFVSLHDAASFWSRTFHPIDSNICAASARNATPMVQGEPTAVLHEKFGPPIHSLPARVVILFSQLLRVCVQQRPGIHAERGHQIQICTRFERRCLRHVQVYPDPSSLSLADACHPIVSQPIVARASPPARSSWKTVQ